VQSGSRGVGWGVTPVAPRSQHGLRSRPVSRLPAWAAGIVALVCVVGRVVLIFRPFISVEVMMLAGRAQRRSDRGKAS
jgi:hypothetical protein